MSNSILFTASNVHFTAFRTASKVSTSTEEPPYPTSYLEVVKMMSKGITPPGLKTDVDDTPDNPTAPLDYSSASQPKKPWKTTPNTSSPFNFALEAQPDEDEDLPRNIGVLDHSSQENSEAELSDIELV